MPEQNDDVKWSPRVLGTHEADGCLRYRCQRCRSYVEVAHIHNHVCPDLVEVREIRQLIDTIRVELRQISRDLSKLGDNLLCLDQD